MTLLLDTHALLWWLANVELTDTARGAIEDPAVVVVASAASVWEIAIKRATGKLRFDRSTTEAIARSGFEPLAITGVHAERAGELPMHHRDPFDRLLVAQAQAEHLTIVTRDPAFDAYDVAVLRA